MASRLATSSPVKKLMPVALPFGRPMLATRPSLTGSSPTLKTIGIVEVAALAARAPEELTGTAMTVTEKARGRDENVHAIEYAPATHHVEAVQQEGLEEPSVLRLAAREHAVDRSPKRAGHSCAVGGGMRKEIRGVAHDREAHALDVAYLAVGIDERGQVCAMSEFPINLGNREAVVLEKAGALFHRAGKKRHI